MASNENFLPRTLTQLFNDYVTYELSKLSYKQVKMNKFYDYVVNYATKHPMAILDSQIKLDNTNIKSIYFNESRWENLKFEIFESNDMEIVINEKHKIDNFIMKNCNDIDLIFGLESSKDGFTNRNNFSFQECKFKTIDIRSALEDKNQFVFNYKLNFSNCEIGEMDRIENKKFNDSLTFKNTTFIESVNFNDKMFNDNIKFIKCTFKDNACFSDSIFNKICIFNKTCFEKEAYFRNCTFNDIKDKSFSNDFVRTDFSMTVFKDNAYFNGSEFNQALILYGTQFNKLANFIDVKLNNFFEFSSCLYVGTESINFAMLEATTNIKVLQKNINKITKEALEHIKRYNKQKKTQDTKNAYLESLRNSFSFIKHNFIQRNNLIEAQKYKIAEFYVEELRLKYVRKTRGGDQQDSGFLKTTINYLQLLFYRHTSNHHTDLLKSFHTMLLLIGLFSIFNFGIVMISNFSTDNFIFNLPNILKSDKAFIVFSIQILRNLFIIIIFFLSFLGLLYLKNITNRLIVFFPSFHKHLSLKNMIKDIKKNKKNRPTICRAFMFSFLIFVTTSYVCSFLLLAISPKSIISITNLFSGNQHILDPLSALSGIYTILFILLIYSLQKTSRRNSIM